MRKQSEIETFIIGRRNNLGINPTEFYLSTVGSRSTWAKRMKNPLSLTQIESQRIFQTLRFNKEHKEVFYRLMEEEYERNF